MLAGPLAGPLLAGLVQDHIDQGFACLIINNGKDIAAYLDQHRPDDLRELAQDLMDAASHYVVMVQALKAQIE